MAIQRKYQVCMLLFLSFFSFLFVIQLLQSSSSGGCINPGSDCINYAFVMQQGKYRRMISYYGEKKVVFKNDVLKKTPVAEGWELRAAPMGPDPLHHHGDVPKKPWTP